MWEVPCIKYTLIFQAEVVGAEDVKEEEKHGRPPFTKGQVLLASISVKVFSLDWGQEWGVGGIQEMIAIPLPCFSFSLSGSVL